MNVTLVIVFGWLGLTTLVGIAAGLRRRREATSASDEFMVGGRRFGAVILYVMMAAEIYSAFAFLGLAGWSYKHGAPILYAVGYGSIAYVIFFFFGPRVNRLGKRFGYLTQPDYATDRYDSRALGIFVAVLGMIAIAIYLQLQITGAGIIVELASNEAISAGAARIIAFSLIIVFVSVSGIRGVGWTNLLQAVAMLVGMVTVGFVFAHKFFDGVVPMFAELQRVSPAHLTLEGAQGGHGLTLYSTRIAVLALGFWMWPHIFQATYAAKNERIIRRNACVLPLYQLALMPVILVGFTSFLVYQKRGVTLEPVDHAMVRPIVEFFPDWFAGAVAAGGLAAAVSTSSALILSMSTLFARNIFQQGFYPAASDNAVTRVARFGILPLTAISVGLSFWMPDDLVSLLLKAFGLPAQLAPALLLGTFWPRVHRRAVITGLIVGVSVLAAISIWPIPTWIATWVPSTQGFYFALWGLLPNAAIVIIWSALRPVDPRTKSRFGPVLWPEVDNPS